MNNFPNTLFRHISVRQTFRVTHLFWRLNGTLRCVRGITLDGRFETHARVVDVEWLSEPCEPGVKLPPVAKFEVGKTYATRSICDSECIVRVTIAKRTAKTITTTEGKTFRVGEWQGAETVKPWGSYSMCPVVSATDTRLAG